MKNRGTIAMFAVLCLIALGLGYVYGKWRQDSGGGNEGNPEGNGKDINKEVTPKEPESLKQGLVAYYPFNGNAKDESGNGNDGEVNGTTLTKDRHGNAERAYNFDGIDDYITLPSRIFDEVDGFTLSAWVNVNSTRVTHCIISGALAGNDNRLIISIWGTRFCIFYINQRQDPFPADELMGGWKHIVVTKLLGQPTFIVFVDGLFKAKVEYPRSGQLKFAPNGLMIGPEQDSPGGGFHPNEFLMGVVDDYRIYNRALSAAEVKELYEFEKTD